jgi:hypothetical protein
VGATIVGGGGGGQGVREVLRWSSSLQGVRCVH